MSMFWYFMLFLFIVMILILILPASWLHVIGSWINTGLDWLIKAIVHKLIMASNSK